MTVKEPVLLTVLIETNQFRWYVAAIGAAGDVTPLICSEPGNLDTYVTSPFDEQLSFLRHRFSGVLQRGCDRLWPLQKKPSQFVFVADGPFAQALPELTHRVAEHMTVWMTNPPVSFLVSRPGFLSLEPSDLELIAGEFDAQQRLTLQTALPKLANAISQSEAWELIPSKKAEPK